MSELTVFQPGKLPAHLRQHELSAATKALIGNPSIKRISIKGGVWRLIVGGREVTQIEDRYLDMIIAAAAPYVSRVFYGQKYDPDTAAAPLCWSNDGSKPDAAVAQKQAPTCGECKNNIKGSGEGDSRACRFQQRLAVMLPSDLDSGLYQLTVPAASIFPPAEGDKRPLKAYATYLGAMNPPVSVEIVVTRARFDTAAESPKLFFSPQRYLTDEEYAVVMEAGKSAEAAQCIALTVAQADNVPGAATGEQPVSGERPKAAEPKVDEPLVKAEKKPRVKPVKEEPAAVSAEADPEPEKRSPPKDVSDAVPKQAADLTTLVGEWDDD